MTARPSSGHGGALPARTWGLGCRALSTLLVVAVVGGWPMALVSLAPRGATASLVAGARHPITLLHALARPLTAADVVGSLIVLAGLVWAWMVVCLVVELWARRRGLPTPRLPASGWVQRTAGVLVTGSLAVVPALRVGAMTVRPAPAIVVADAQTAAAPTAALTPGAQAAAGADLGTAVTGEDGGAPATYVVQPGDTLWSIAQRQLGNPLRWRELAACNLGRPQPDGATLVDDHWIRPGWVLAIPPCVAAPSGVATNAASVTDLEPAPARPWHLSGLGAPSPASGGRLTASPAAGARPTPPVAPPEGWPPSTAAAHLPSPRAANRQQRGVDPYELVEFGLLAAAVVALVDRLRRVQHRRRPTGLRIALPPDDVAALEQRLRRRADSRSGPTPAALWAAARGALGMAGANVPVAAVRVADGEALEVLLAPGWGAELPAPAPAARPGTRPGWWALPWDQAPDEDPVRTGPPPTAAVTLGRHGGSELFVDLGVLGLLSVAGPHADAACRALAVELASGGPDDLELVLVGFDQGFSAFDRVRCLDDITLAAAIAQRRVAEHLAGWHRQPVAGAGAVATARTGPGRPDADDGAAAAVGMAAPCTVVVCVLPVGSPLASCRADAAWAAAVDRLVALGLAGTGAVGVVLAWPVPDVGWQLRARDDGRLDLCWAGEQAGDGPVGDGPVGDGPVGDGPADDGPVGDGPADDGPVGDGPPRDAVAALGQPVAEGIEVQRIGTRTAAMLATAVRTASDVAGVLPMPAAPTPGRGPDGSGAGVVEVRVLGPVEVTGAERPFTRAWTLELVVYLALHPAGATTDQWATALWPDRLPAPATLHSTASAARRALGGDESGADHLPRSHGRLQLAPTVTTDWQRFEALAAEDGPAAWERALQLVRGRPLDGLRVADWALLDGILPAMEAAIVDVAERTALAALDRGVPEQAQWAARRGLLVCPYDERLYRILLRAADMAGNPAGVEAAMAELVRLVAEDVEPYDAVHPETLELYRALSRRGEQLSR